RRPPALPSARRSNSRSATPDRAGRNNNWPSRRRPPPAAGPLLPRLLGRSHRRPPRVPLLRPDPPHPHDSARERLHQDRRRLRSSLQLLHHPQLRGKFRSRRMSSIVAEAENLIAQGVREITVIGQDTTCYGEDLGFTDGLATLLDSLAILPGLRWLRFLYTYPNKVTTCLLETMAKHNTIAKYLDVPLQHASPSVLKRMKRGGNAQIFLDLIAKARRIVPGIVIRTSFIVGFPGETEADYKELEAFINDFSPHDSLVPGTFYRAEITDSHDYDVVARILE